jgi:hypothetical protein
VDLNKLLARVLKPGYLTTEFLVTLVLVAVAQLTAWGVITPAGNVYAKEHVQLWAQIVVGAVGIAYALSRAIAKHSLAPLLAFLNSQGCAPDRRRGQRQISVNLLNQGDTLVRHNATGSAHDRVTGL